MNFRKFNKSLLAIGLATLYTVSTFAATATDVAANHWAYAAVTDLENRGIITYNSKGQFLPNSTMTFFEVADILAKATACPKYCILLHKLQALAFVYYSYQ